MASQLGAGVRISGIDLLRAVSLRSITEHSGFFVVEGNALLRAAQENTEANASTRTAAEQTWKNTGVPGIPQSTSV